jgi:hypothetical protein
MTDELIAAALTTLRRQASPFGIKIGFRNRGGKKYITVNYQNFKEGTARAAGVPAHSNWSYAMGAGKWLVLQYFPRAMMTSGGPNSSTYRLNP